VISNEKIRTLLDDICLRGSQDSYRELFVSLHAQLVDFSCSILHSNEDAEEVVSDFFINLWQKKEQFAKITNPRLYIYICVKNLSLNKLNARKKIPVLSQQIEWEASMQSVFFNPEELLMSREVVDKLMGAINELPPRCRTIFKLVKNNGLQYKEVAALMNVSVKTVEAQMAIALRRIKTNIGFRNEFPELHYILTQKKF